MIYLSIEISKCELYNAEFCNLKIDFLILQTIHQDVCRDDGTGSDGRRILWRTVSQKTFVFLIKQLVKVSPLILFSELFLYQTFNLRDAIHLAEAQVPWHLLISVSCAGKATQRIFFFSYFVFVLYQKQERKNSALNRKNREKTSF